MTDESGYYVVSNLLAANYSVTVEQSGYKTVTRTGNVLTAGGRLDVDIPLVLGAASEQVTVVPEIVIGFEVALP